MRFTVTYVPFTAQAGGDLAGFRVGAPASIDIRGRHFDLGEIREVTVQSDGSIATGFDLDEDLVAEMRGMFPATETT